MTATQPILDEDVAKVVPGVVDTEVGEHIAVINPADDQIHILNATAAAIWSAIPTTATVGELIAEVANRVGRPPEAVAQDIRNTLTEFVRADLITVGLANFTLGPPDFTVDTHRSSPSAHLASRRRPHPALAKVLDATDWLRTTGPVMAAGTPIIIRTNDPMVADEIDSRLTELPPQPEPAVDDEPDTTQGPDVDDETGARRPDPRRAYDPRNEPRAPGSLADALPWAITGPAHPSFESTTGRPIVISAVTKVHRARPRHRLYIDGVMRWKGNSSDALTNMLRSELNRLAVEHTNDHILMHAGAVERDGVVIAITGPSGHGKSTLTAALAQRGFNYVTDEVMAFEPDTLEVLAFPKALDLDARSEELLGLDTATNDGSDTSRATTPRTAKTAVAPRVLGEVSTGGRLALLVLLGDPGDTEARDDDTSATDDAVTHPAGVATLIELLGGVFRESFADPRCLEALAGLERRVALLRLARMPIEAACETIIEAFEELAPRSATS